MAVLSISAAWEQTKAILARDGRLFASVALALVALPAAVTGLLDPAQTSSSTAAWADVLYFIASLIALAGQLALMRLALGPSITVGAAITHGLKRMPIYLVAGILVLIVLLIIAIPFAVALIALGVPLDSKQVPPSGPVVIAGLIYFVIACFVGTRMIMAAPAASAEPIGPLAILKRSWRLTHGNFWRLFAFLLIFFVGAIALLVAVGAVATLLASVLLGPPQPLSASALIVALIQAITNAAVTVLFGVMLARIYAQLAGRAEAQPGVPSSGM